MATPTKLLGKRTVILCCACHGEHAYVAKKNDRCGYCEAINRPPQEGDAPPPKPKPRAAKPPAVLSPVEVWATARRDLPAKKRWPTLRFGGPPEPRIRTCQLSDDGRRYD